MHFWRWLQTTYAAAGQGDLSCQTLRQNPLSPAVTPPDGCVRVTSCPVGRDKGDGLKALRRSGRCRISSRGERRNVPLSLSLSAVLCCAVLRAEAVLVWRSRLPAQRFGQETGGHTGPVHLERPAPTPPHPTQAGTHARSKHVETCPSVADVGLQAGGGAFCSADAGRQSREGEWEREREREGERLASEEGRGRARRGKAGVLYPVGEQSFSNGTLNGTSAQGLRFATEGREAKAGFDRSARRTWCR